jgi:hypothetical protein
MPGDMAAARVRKTIDFSVRIPGHVDEGFRQNLNKDSGDVNEGFREKVN